MISLVPGQRIRQYEIIQRVGQGGFGEVYSAFDVDDRQEYALKLPLPNPDSMLKSELEEYIKRSRREAALVQLTSHDNVLPLHEFILVRAPGGAQVPVLVFPFIRGLNLAQHVHAHRPSLRVILHELVRALASALAELHRHTIFHRDIKPNNILVRSSDGRVFIIDLGIATSRSSKTQTAIGTMLGTEAFLSPENLAHFVSLDGSRFTPTPQGDIYALGVTLYEVLGGLNPLRPLTQQHRSNVLAYAAARQTYEVTPLKVLNPALPSAVSELVMKCMALKPADRFATGTDLVLTIDQLLESTVSDARYDAPYVPPESDVAVLALSRSQSSPAPTSAQRPSAGANRHPSMSLPVVTSAVDRSINLDVEDLDDTGAPPESRHVGSGNTAGGGFKPPTRQIAAGFEAPDAAAPVSVEKPRGEASLPTAIRRARQQLEAPVDAGRRTRRMVFAGGGALVLLVLLALILSTPRPATDTSSSRSLLLQDDGGVAEGALATPRAAPAMIAAPVTPPPVPAVLDAGVPAPLLAAVTPPSRPSGRRQNADAKAVDDILAREYGGKRPVVGGAVAPTEEKYSAEDEWYYQTHPLVKRGSRNKPTVDAGLPPLGVALGSEIAAVLTKPLNSTTVGFGPAVVQVVQPFRVKGETVIPIRTLGYGTAQPSRGGRFTVHFTRLKFPDGREYAIDAIAYDAIDGQPGLRALKSTYVVQGGASTAELVARGVATTALGKVPGGDVSDVAKNAGGTVINGSGQQPSGPYQVEELRLEPNYELNIFVSSPF